MSGVLVQKRTLVRSKELKGLSVSRSHLWNLAKAGKIERVGRGLYRAKEAPISTNETLLEIAKRVPLGVLCLSSALRFYELTTENPLEVWLAIERGAWSPKLDYPPVRVVHSATKRHCGTCTSRAACWAIHASPSVLSMIGYVVVPDR